MKKNMGNFYPFEVAVAKYNLKWVKNNFIKLFKSDDWVGYIYPVRWSGAKSAGNILFSIA